MTDSSTTPALKLSRKKIWIFRGIVICVPVLIGLVIFKKYNGQEVLQQLVDPDAPIYFRSPDHEESGLKSMYDPLLGWKNVPNEVGKTYGPEVKINSKGLRDDEYDYEKPDGVKRVLVLGDSYTWGYGVAHQEIFTEVLEKQLNENSKTKYEVINTGVCGYGTDQQYLFLKEEGFKYQPDLVIVAFFLGNDPLNNISSNEYGLQKPVFVDEKLELGNVPVPKPKDKAGDLILDTDPFRITMAIFNALGEQCKKHECDFVVMKFGTFIEEKPELGDIDREFRVEFRENEHDYFYYDLDRDFRRKELTGARLIGSNYNHHWDSFGHEQTGLLLYQYLINKELVDIPKEPTPN